jgi:hypothetical protein
MKIEDGICTAILGEDGKPLDMPSSENRLVNGAFEVPPFAKE